MAGAAENGAGAVVHQHEIGDVDRQALVRDQRIDAAQAGIETELFRLLDRFFAGAGLGAFGDEFLQVGTGRGEFGCQRMIRCDRHEAGAEQGVRTRGEDLERVMTALDREADQSPLGAADPALLHGPDLVRPALQTFQRFEQFVGEFGDLEEPLGELAALDHRAGPPAAAVDHLLIGEHGVVDRVPVDRALLAIGEARLEKVEEHRLLMTVVARIAGREFAAPVEGQAERGELLLHRLDIAVGGLRGVDAFGDRRVFRRQAEGVPAHGMHHLEALGHLVARDDVTERVVAHMAHMQKAGRIGKHLEHVVSRPIVVIPDFERLLLGPDLLPFGLGVFERIAGHR